MEDAPIMKIVMDGHAMKENNMQPILVGSYPSGHPDLKVLLTAICGEIKEGQETFQPYIDSRLEVVRCKFSDTTDGMDEALRQRRYTLELEDFNSFAVLLYRLYELTYHIEDKELVDDGMVLFDDFIWYFFGVEEGETVYLLDTPNIYSCPECGSDDSHLEQQDQVYLCHNCQWVGDYQSRWPYVHASGDHLGRLDSFVKERYAPGEHVY